MSDEAVNLLRQTDARGNTTSFQYDELSRRTSRLLPDGASQETTTYANIPEVAGSVTNVLQEVVRDFQGRSTTITHDRLDRIKTKALPAVSAAATNLTFYFTPGGQLDHVVTANTSGNVARTSYYGYDNLNRLRQKDTPEGVLAYTYTLDNHLQTLQSYRRTAVPVNGAIPTGAMPDVSLKYNYDNLGRLYTVMDNLLGSPNTTTYIYDPVGNLDHFVYPNGVVHQYGYNELNRLRQLDVTNSLGAVLRRYAYSMNSTGQRTGVIESAGNPVAQRRRVAYEYDQIYGTSATTTTRINRLTRETLYNASDAVAGTITHAYDAVGNRTARTVANFSPSISGLGNQTLAYDQRDLIDGDANPANANPWFDLNGNSLADETGAGTGDIYDAENRLIQRGSGIFFSYDENGNRVKKVTPSGTTYYLVDDRNPTGYAQVLAEYTSVNSSVAPTVTYTIGAELISQNRSDTVRYYGYDGQGSVRFLTDAAISTAGGPATQITDTYDYEAFGMLLVGSGTTPNNFGYTGQQWDADLGMYYLRARYYLPGIGRFWTMDTYQGNNEQPSSLHKYSYCAADPVNKLDPSGHFGIFKFTRTFGNEAHRVIEDEYQAEHPGAIVGATKGILSTGLKPDIFNGIDRTYAEIKPLSLSGVASGIAQIAAYDVAFNALGVPYRRETSWPVGVKAANVFSEPIAFFNVGGLIFYTDMTSNVDDLAKITTVAAAREFIRRGLVQRTLQGALIRIPGLVAGREIGDTGRAGVMTGIATLNSLMGAP